MKGSSARTSLFAGEPVAELRGLASLSDPDEAGAVIDLAVIGARGDGKTQFIVHAIRAMHAHAPALAGAEQTLNRDVLRLVLDPRATRPDATPPGIVPHATFRMRTTGLLGRLGITGAIALVRRATGVGAALILALLLVGAGVAADLRVGPTPAAVFLAGAILVGAVAIAVARRRIAHLGDVEVAFWDVAGEQVYSSSAVDYYNLLAHLVASRRARAEALGRPYAFAPILICNPIALGSADEGSPYERMRQLLPLFAALDEHTANALVAINRWAVVDPICARGALRDEVVSVSTSARGEPGGPAHEVSREQVRAHCLDAEDGRDRDVRITYVRYDTAIKAQVEVDKEAGTLAYAYDDGPGAFSGDAAPRFLDWVLGLVRWEQRQAAEAPAEAAAPAPAPAPLPSLSPPAAIVDVAARSTALSSATPPYPFTPARSTGDDVWARPAGGAESR
ncbi:MAG TPA: hypothetical protein VGM88_08580 [Kofleriaceae bacterium]|jgi:hypothetical protein